MGPTDEFTVGPGVMGATLNEKRQELQNECRMRLGQIGLGADWSGVAVEWPLTYIDKIQDQVNDMLDFI